MAGALRQVDRHVFIQAVGQLYVRIDYVHEWLNIAHELWDSRRVDLEDRNDAVDPVLLTHIP